MAGPVSVPDNLVKWDSTTDPLAPLSKDQKFNLSLLEDEIAFLDPINLRKKPAKEEILKVNFSKTIV